MKKTLFFAAACIALAGCSSDGFIGDTIATSNGEITFSQTTPNITRAAGTAADAAKLNNNFIVYGFKMDKDATEAADGTGDKKVIDLYNVKYTEGSAYSTQSNTTGWEYVGYTSQTGVTQSIKYWDFNSKYVFSAVSCGEGIIASKITDASKIAGTKVQEKGWELVIPKGTSLTNLYASDRKEIEKKKKDGSTTYSFETVGFTFYSLATRIRFGFYETVPGYTVKIDTFYYGDDQATKSESNFAINGTFKGTNPVGETKFIVTYDASNHPVLTYNSESTATSKLFGSNLPSSAAIGETSNAATYDQIGNEYTLILPYQSQSLATPEENVLSLKLSYTLVSTDGSGEEIKVHGATAYVPTQYTQWKNNYAYTYLFKISDNTSGSTGDDPDDPKGLYPITFDACVESVSDGTQESITTVADASITTYQAGQVVTTQDGYNAGNIDVQVYDLSASSDKNVTLSKSNLKLYAALITDGTVLTEKNVENYMNNGIVLTDVSSSIKNYNTFSSKTATFSAKAGQIYVVEYINGSKKSYKVIKVVGTREAIKYQFDSWENEACKVGLTYIDEGSTFYVTATQLSAVQGIVTGAAKCFHASNLAVFDITETTKPGTYKFTAKAGTSGAFEIRIQDSGDKTSDVTINPYEFALPSVEVIADAATEDTISLKISDLTKTPIEVNPVTTAQKADFEVTEGLNIKSVDGGVVTLTAAKNAKDGTIKYKNNGVVVATADVIVKHYSFVAPTKVINIGSVESAEKYTDITMELGGETLTASKAITVTTTPSTGVLSTPPTKTNDDGEFRLSAGTVSGTAVVKAPDDTEVTIEVKNFKVTVSGEKVTFTDNGTAVNASIQVTDGELTKSAADGEYLWKNASSGAKITYTYKGVTFTLYKKS